MRVSIKWGIAVAVAVVAVGVAVVAGARGTAVQVMVVKRGAIVQSVVASGRINAPARMDIGAEVTATVLEVPAREGDRVKAGDLLVRLSDAEASATLAQARAALVETQGRARQQARVGAPVADQALVQAQAAATAAESEFARATELVAKGFFSQQKLDEARRALDTARSALAAAQVQADANRPDGVEPALAAARVVQAQAAVDAAAARLARLQIRSPVDAVVLARNVEPGSMAQPGRVLLALAAQGDMRIDAAVDEKHLRLLKPGMAARAVADAFPGQPFDAKLSYIAPSVDPQRGSVDVRLAVPQAPAFLRPDMTVSVEMVGGVKNDALVLPSGAIRDADREAPWVLALQDGRAVRVPVKLGLRGVGSVEVAEGLQAGDAVIPQTGKALPGDKVHASRRTETASSLEVPSSLPR